MLKSQFEVPSDLFQKVINRINLERSAAKMRRRFVFAAVLFVLIAAAAVPVVRAFWSDLQKSGLGQYSLLMLSDFKTVSSNWQDFAMSIAESFPIVSTTGLLAVVLAMLLTLKFAVKYSRGIFKSSLRLN